jgi:hypothetical protein
MFGLSRIRNVSSGMSGNQLFVRVMAGRPGNTLADSE